MSTPVALNCVVAQAQTPPSAQEIAAYQGVHLAAHQGDAEGLREFIREGADVDGRDGHGRTAAHVAAFASHDDALRVLAEAGADMHALENGRYDVVTIASVLDDRELVSLAIKLGNRPDNITSIYDGTALIAAAHLGHHRVVEVLIGEGAPLDHVNNLGWTALMEAVILGDGGEDHTSTVQALVEAGADVTIADRAGRTPLEHAQARGYSEIIDILKRGR